MNRIAPAWLGLTLAFASSAFDQGGPPAVTPDGALRVFVFAGQSNAVGVDTLGELRADQLAPQPNVLFYGPNESGNIWGPLTPSSTSPNLIDGLNRTGGSFGPEISAGKTISNALGGALVAEVKFAVGGTALFDRWNPASGDLYRNMVARVNQSLADLHTQLGLTGYVAGFFWMQGESDAIALRTDYAENLRNFIASVRRDFKNPNLPFVFGQIIDFDQPVSTPLREQQQAVADDNTVTNKAFILTDDLAHDFIHFTGQAIYTLGQRFGTGYLSIVASTVADFNGDGHPDLVLRNANTRQTAIWYLNNNVRLAGANGPTLPGASWSLVGVADFNGDGHPDYVLYNANTRQTAIWYLNNNVRLAGANGPILPGASWSLVGVADFNGDGHPDYVLYNANTRQTAIWYLNNNVRLAGANGPILPGASWSLVGVADFNGDGHPDYVLYNANTRQTAIWYLNNNVRLAGANGPILPGASWSLVGVADFNGDNHPDYVLFNANTRQTAIWYLNNNVRFAGANGPILPAGWSLVGQ